MKQTGLESAGERIVRRRSEWSRSGHHDVAELALPDPEPPAAQRLQSRRLPIPGDAESRGIEETAAGNCHLWMDECFNVFWVNTVIALYDEDRITIWGYYSRGCGKNSQPFSSRKTGSSE